MWPAIHRYELANETFWKPIARFLVALILMIPFLAAFVLVKRDHISNIYLLAIVKSLIPAFICGFILFGVADIVNMKIKLLELTEKE